MDSQDSIGSGSGGSGGFMRRSSGGGGSRLQQQSMVDEEDDDDVMSPATMSRLEALASFKSFMQGLDNQPQAYSLDEFIRGAANAIKVSL